MAPEEKSSGAFWLHKKLQPMKQKSSVGYVINLSICGRIVSARSGIRKLTGQLTSLIMKLQKEIRNI